MSSQDPEDSQFPWNRFSADEDATRFISGDSPDDQSDLEFDDDLSVDALLEGESSLYGSLGEYGLLEQIGSGGMGRVFRAEHKTMHREVALKILSDHIANNERLRQQFFSEIRAVAKLMHPNIVTAFDAGSVGNVHYLVMELVDGAVLSSTVQHRGPMSMEGAVSVLEQAGKALAYAHELGVVHRDIKPSNMMLTTTGVLKLLDFGLAHIVTQEKKDPGTTKRIFMGTPEFMSPEQIESPDSVDGRSDLYSLGASLCYLLTGRAMFMGEKMQVAKAHLNEVPKPLYEIRPDVDLRLDTVFQRLVAKHPEDRYESAEQLLEHLDALELFSEPVTGLSLRSGAYRLASDSPTRAGAGHSTLSTKGHVVGIDLGLQTSCAAFYDPISGPQIIAQGGESPFYVRNMLWSSGQEVCFGSEANAKRQADPDKIFHSLQRWIGLPQVQRPFGEKHVSPEVLLGAFLRKIMQNAATTTDGSCSAIVTVPACYDQMHRRAIRNACRIAGIDLVQLLDKPLATAVAWLDINGRLLGQGKMAAPLSERILVVQLTGTGLEASVLHAQGMDARQLGVSGHWKLGQQRWQHRLLQYLSDLLFQKSGKQIRNDLAAATRLQRTVEIAMNQLANASKVEVRFDWNGASIHQTVSQQDVVRIAADLTLSIQQSIATACEIAKLDLSEIDRVLLSGTMMRMKPVQQIVTEVIPHAVEVTWMEQADMARGAAIVAHDLASFSRTDIPFPKAHSSTAHDIALLVESPDRVQQRPRVLIEKGSPIPADYSRTLRPKEGEDRNVLPVLQMIESSSLGRGNWLKLGRVDPQEVFGNLESGQTIQLRLEIDASGILRSCLFHPQTKQTFVLPVTSDPELAEDELPVWRRFLEDLMPPVIGLD